MVLWNLGTKKAGTQPVCPRGLKQASGLQRGLVDPKLNAWYEFETTTECYNSNLGVCARTASFFFFFFFFFFQSAGGVRFGLLCYIFASQGDRDWAGKAGSRGRGRARLLRHHPSEGGEVGGGDRHLRRPPDGEPYRLVFHGCLLLIYIPDTFHYEGP